MKKKIKMSKKRTNKINNRKRSIGYYTGGKEIPPKWKQYAHKTEAAYLEEQQMERMQRDIMERERRERERRERDINRVLTNIFIQSIMTLIMNSDQSQRFEAYIRENIRMVNNRGELNQMIDDFVNFAVTNLLDNQQRLQTNRIMEAVQEERIARSRANQPFETLDILDVIERVFRENISGGGYYKHFTRKNRSNRRK